MGAEPLPGVVRKVSLLLAAAAVLAMLTAVAAIAAWRHLGDAEAAFVRALARDGQSSTDLPQQVRFGLGFNLAAALLTTAAAASLAVLTRWPRRSVKVSAWWFTALAWLGLGFGLTTGPDVTLLPGPLDPKALQRMQEALVPSWYSSVNALLTAGVLVALTAAAALLINDTASDFYRSRTRHEEDPRWAAVFRKQDEPEAAADRGAPGGTA